MELSFGIICDSEAEAYFTSLNEKILLLSHSQKSGGAERCLLEAAIGLKKQGYEVTVFMPSDGELNEMLVSVNISTLVTSYPYWVHKNKWVWGLLIN